MAGGATIGALRFVLGADTAQFEKNIKGAETALKKVVAVGTAAGVVLGNAITSAFNSIKEGVTKALNEADEMGKLAQTIGVSTEQLSALRYAADLSGVSLESLTTNMQKLGRSMTEALTDKSSTVARTFDAIGISVSNSSGQLRSINDVLLELAEKFSQWQDGAAKSTIAMNLFGRAGAEMIPFLNAGRDGIQELTEEARRLGLIVGDETAKKAEQFNDTMTKLNRVWDGLVTQIAARLVPTLQLVADWFIKLSQNAETMKYALDTVDFAIKSIITSGIIVKTVFETLSTAIAAVVAALVLLGQLEFRAALDTLKQGAVDFTAEIRKSVQALRDLWAEAGNISNVAGKLGEEAPRAAAPVVASANAMRDAMRAARDEARYMLDTIVNSPTETFVAKMAAIEQALRNGTITMRQFGEMTRRVQKENQQHMLDLGTATATALTTIFGKNKAASIAAAIINTAVGITRALSSLPPPFSWAQAALIAASGAAQIAQIKSTNMSGSGNAPTVSGSGGGQSDQQQAAPAQTLMVQGLTPGQFLGTEYVRDFAQKLLDFQKDGGVVVLK